MQHEDTKEALFASALLTPSMVADTNVMSDDGNGHDADDDDGATDDDDFYDGDSDGETDDEATTVENAVDRAVEGMSPEDASEYRERYRQALDNLNASIQEQMQSASASPGQSAAVIAAGPTQRGEIPVVGSFNLMRSNDTLRSALGTPFRTLTEVSLYHVVSGSYTGPKNARLQTVTSTYNRFANELRGHGMDVSLKSEHDVHALETLIDTIASRYAASVGALAVLGDDLTAFEKTVGQPMQGYHESLFEVAAYSYTDDAAASEDPDVPDLMMSPSTGAVGAASATGSGTAATASSGPQSSRLVRKRGRERHAMPSSGDACPSCNRVITAISHGELKRDPGGAFFTPLLSHRETGRQAYHYFTAFGGLKCPEFDDDITYRAWGPVEYSRYKTDKMQSSRNSKRSREGAGAGATDAN